MTAKAVSINTNDSDFWHYSAREIRALSDAAALVAATMRYFDKNRMTAIVSTKFFVGLPRRQSFTGEKI